YGVIDFGHIRFVVRARAVPGVVREDELVGRCAYPRVRDTKGLGQGWRGRSMRPARVTRRRHSSRIVCDRARMVAAIGELEAIRLVSVNLSMGRVSTIGSRTMVAAVISELEARHFVYVNRRISRMRSIVGLRGRMRQVIGRVLRRLVRSDGGEI